jgi:hypothetical protein
MSMNQDLISNQDSLAAGGNGTLSGGFATGTVCQTSGTYRASNKYIDIILAVAVGDVFQPGPDGKKTTWYPLSSSLSSNKSGDFNSVKVQAGTL